MDHAEALFFAHPFWIWIGIGAVLLGAAYLAWQSAALLRGGIQSALTGDMIDAREALRIGLVNRVTAQDELLVEARKLAGKIAAKGLVALGLCKDAVGNGLEMDLARACAYEAELFGYSFSTADQKEGMGAFLEKRPPVFRDC